MSTPTPSAKVLVDPGVYYESTPVKWDGIPQATLAFRSSSDSERPIFDGSKAIGTSHYWMNTGGGPSLDVREITVRHYRTGGIRLDTNGNDIHNVTFEELGNQYVPNGPGYAALHLLNSSGNTIRGNVFRDLVNVDCPGCIHAVYAANGSSDNRLVANIVVRITGDPVRLRNATDRNLIANNVFGSSGSSFIDRAMVSFWRFTVAERCGTGNRVDNNTYDGRYYDGEFGQQIFGSGSEPEVPGCPDAITGGGNVLTSQ